MAFSSLVAHRAHEERAPPCAPGSWDPDGEPGAHPGKSRRSFLGCGCFQMPRSLLTTGIGQLRRVRLLAPGKASPCAEPERWSWAGLHPSRQRRRGSGESKDGRFQEKRGPSQPPFDASHVPASRGAEQENPLTTSRRRWASNSEGKAASLADLEGSQGRQKRRRGEGRHRGACGQSRLMGKRCPRRCQASPAGKPPLGLKILLEHCLPGVPVGCLWTANPAQKLLHRGDALGPR